MALKTWLDLMRTNPPNLNYWIRSNLNPRMDEDFWLQARIEDPDLLSKFPNLFIERRVWPLDEHMSIAEVELVRLRGQSRAA